VFRLNNSFWVWVALYSCLILNVLAGGSLLHVACMFKCIISVLPVLPMALHNIWKDPAGHRLIAFSVAVQFQVQRILPSYHENRLYL